MNMNITRRLAPSAHVTWYRSKYDTPVFELRLDQQRVLCAEHPALIAGALHASGADTVEFSNVERDDGRLDYCTTLPMNIDDLLGLEPIAVDDDELRAILTVMLAMSIYVADYDRSLRLAEMPTSLHHWHAACMLLPDELVLSRPHHPLPDDWSEWFGERLTALHYPRVTDEDRILLGAAPAVFVTLPADYEPFYC
jgi:hypothetical protein